MTANDYASKARLLATLSNAFRLELLTIILQREYSVGDLARTLNISQSSLSQHLARLRDENLVSARKEAQTVYYRSNSDAVRLLLTTLDTIFAPEIAPFPPGEHRDR